MQVVNIKPDRSHPIPGSATAPDRIFLHSASSRLQKSPEIHAYDLKRTEGDNPTIGIVLCSETSKDIARYSILHDSDNLFAAKYMPLMPTEEELRREIEQQKELYRLQQENK